MASDLAELEYSIECLDDAVRQLGEKVEGIQIGSEIAAFAFRFHALEQNVEDIKAAVDEMFKFMVYLNIDSGEYTLTPENGIKFSRPLSEKIISAKPKEPGKSF